MRFGSRAPHGARGLKQIERRVNFSDYASRPAWGAWIETQNLSASWSSKKSRPAWGAWIETIRPGDELRMTYVAPRMGRVD